MLLGSNHIGAGLRIHFTQQEFVRQYRTADAAEQWAGGEKGDWERDWDDWTSKVGGMKALRWIFVWILTGARMQLVDAAEEQIPARREMERMLETAPAPRVGGKHCKMEEDGIF